MADGDAKRAADVPTAVPYKVLRQTHDTYSAEQIERVEELYEGGWRIMQSAERYCPQLPLEHDAYYRARLAKTAYAPYFGQIVDQFVSDLGSQPMTVSPAGDAANPDTPGVLPNVEFYSRFADDVDGEGHSVEEVAGDVLTTGLKHRVAYLQVDAPRIEGAAPKNRAEEEKLGGGRCYAFELPVEQVIDWKIRREQGPDGERFSAFEFCVLFTSECERRSPWGGRDKTDETFTVWTLVAGENGREVARWDQFRYSYDESSKPTDDTMVPWVDGGTTSFDRIPILIFDVPKGLWVGNKIGPLALEHWVRRSELVGAESKGCISIPWVALGPELPAVGEGLAAAQEDENRGDDPVGQFHKDGYLRLGHDDKLEIAETHGHVFEVLDKQVDHVRETMYAVNHQMAASVRANATALGRSGLSKQKDQDKTDKVLGALGRLVRGFWERVYDTVAKSRGERVVWVASGLDNYETYDRQAVIQEATAIPQVAIPSPTFRKEHCKRVAAVLVPGLPPDTVAQVAKEIDAGVDADEERRKLELDAKKKAASDAIKAPSPGADGNPAGEGGGGNARGGPPKPGGERDDKKEDGKD